MTNDQGIDSLVAHAEEYPDFESREHRYDRLHRNERREKARPRMQKKRGEAKKFRAWDGEGSRVPDGQKQPYMLFGYVEGNGVNKYIKAKQLRTVDCLEMILRSPADAINFGFAFSYDVNQILCDLPFRALVRLALRNSCRWNGYRIEYIASKWFRVARLGDDGVIQGTSRTIYDVFNFFNRSLVSALNEYKIGTDAEREYLTEQKANRPDFTWEEIQAVIRYWQLEGRLMVKLMDYMRDLFNQAGFYPSTWHGPAVLSKQMLGNHGIDKCMVDMRKLNVEVWLAARYGMTGGRFQQWLAGLWEGPAYNYDIHSAYPYAIQYLPNLATGKWRRNLRVDRSRIRRDRFCIYHIRYDARKRETNDHSYFNKCRPRPLFRRLRNDNIIWTDQVEGWYWSPEAELVKNDPAAEFVEAWEFEDDGTRPFAFIAEVYTKREYHKALGNAIEYAFKLAMNAVYGSLAQRAGWEKTGKAPKWHQLEWAGYVTSMCKAMVYEAASYAYEKGGLITIDTDGVYSTVPIPDHILPNGIGDGLGQWEEQKYDGILIYQNGFYWLKKDGEWRKCRSRGAPRGMVPIDAAWKGLENLEPIRYEKKIFVGLKLAVRQMNSRNWRSWTADPHEVIFGGGPASKMHHHVRRCRLCIIEHEPRAMAHYRWRSSLHNMDPRKGDSYGEYHHRYKGHWSLMYKLPWTEQDENTADDPLEDPELLKIFGDATL